MIVYIETLRFSNMPKENYRLLSKLRRSNVKLDILKLLEEPKTPTDVAKILKKYRETISVAILDLVKEGLVECLNPDDHNFRFYKTNEKGKKVLEDIK